MDNPIVRRLEVLRHRWTEFRSGSRALLVWVCDSENWRMVEAFLELENSDAGAIPDLFVDLRSPFTTPDAHGFELRRELVERFDSSREDLGREGLATDWEPPPTDAAEWDVGALLETCRSFREFYEDLVDELVLVLLPDEVADPEAWRRWLHRLARSSVPDGIRFLILDAAERGVLEGLADAEPERVALEPVDLDLPYAYEELTWEGDPGVPGVLFRRQFVALANAARAGDLEGVRGAARTCLAIATEHGWPTQAMAVEMAHAGALLSHGRPDEAADVYRTAREYAERVVRDEEEGEVEERERVGVRLLAQARMAEASVHVGERNHLEAARLYHGTALLDGVDGDPFLHLENWRMAALCYQRAGDVERSWTCGWQAVEAGSTLDPEGRAASSLGYAGAALMSLCDGPDHATQRGAVDQRMSALLGPGWMSGMGAAP